VMTSQKARMVGTAAHAPMKRPATTWTVAQMAISASGESAKTRRLFAKTRGMRYLAGVAVPPPYSTPMISIGSSRAGDCNTPYPIYGIRLSIRQPGIGLFEERDDQVSVDFDFFMELPGWEKMPESC